MYFSKILRHNIVLFLDIHTIGDIMFGASLDNTTWRTGFTVYLGIVRFGIHKTGA